MKCAAFVTNLLSYFIITLISLTSHTILCREYRTQNYANNTPMFDHYNMVEGEGL